MVSRRRSGRVAEQDAIGVEVAGGYVGTIPLDASPRIVEHQVGVALHRHPARLANQPHALEITARQHSLNFTPGTRYSYTNTGFTMGAIIVSRVSGVPFPEYSRTHFLAPLGMTESMWRTDYSQVVKRRAISSISDS